MLGIPGSATAPSVIAANHDPSRVWDPVVDFQMMSRNVRGFMSLFHSEKPVVCKVHGFCVAGGTDMALCSDLIVAEVASALATGARSGAYSAEQARASFELYSAYPIRLHRSGLLALEAIELSVTSGLSVYDSLYAVLAGALGVPLVTADQRLAAAVPGSVLVS